MYSTLLRNIEYYSQLGNIIIQGDFNAYTNKVPDFVITDDCQFPKSNDLNYLVD